MRKKILIAAQWSWLKIKLLGWRQFINLMTDTSQKLGIAGLAFGIYEKNDNGICIGIALILASGVVTLLINRSKK